MATYTPDAYLNEAIAQALARDRSTRRAQLECELNALFRDFTAKEILAESARRFQRRL
jgi:hypothetical protein